MTLPTFPVERTGWRLVHVTPDEAGNFERLAFVRNSRWVAMSQPVGSVWLFLQSVNPRDYGWPNTGWSAPGEVPWVGGEPVINEWDSSDRALTIYRRRYVGTLAEANDNAAWIDQGWLDFHELRRREQRIVTSLPVLNGDGTLTIYSAGWRAARALHWPDAWPPNWPE